MGGAVKTATKGVSDIGKGATQIAHGKISGVSTLWNSAANPVQLLGSAAYNGLTGGHMDNTDQMKIGAGVGSAVVAARGLGMIGGPAGAAGAAGAVGGPTAGIGGTTAALGQGGAGVLAQSGGVPLLTKVLLGTSVASTLAGYFGVGKSDQDYKKWFDGLSQEDQSSVKQLEDNLSGLQSNTEARNQAVQKVIDDYPNVVAQVHSQVASAKQQAGEDFDSTTKAVMDQAANQLSAKFAAAGGFSSGAFNQGLAHEAGSIATSKLGYVADRTNDAYNKSYNELMGGWQANLSEAEALRSFQQKMLGQGVTDSFNARQNMLTRQAGINENVASLAQKQSEFNDQRTSGVFNSLGSTLGTAAMLPMYQQMFNPNKYQAMQPTNSPSNVPATQGGMRAPRLTGLGGYNSGSGSIQA